MTDIKSTDTKGKIYDAYQELLEQYEALKSQSLTKESSLFDTPRPKVSKNPINDLEAIATAIVGDFAKLKEQFLMKTTELEQLEATITEEKKYLEEILKIKAQAESVFALQDMYTAKEQEFERMIKEKQFEINKKTQDRQFDFEQKKQQETHDRELKKSEKKKGFDAEIEKIRTDLDGRETRIAQQEQENKDLRDRVAQLEKDLATIEQTLSKQLESKIKADYEAQKTLLLKDIETKELIADLEKKNLEAKITDLVKQLEYAQKQIAESNKQIQTMASTVVEGKRPIVVQENPNKQ